MNTNNTNCIVGFTGTQIGFTAKQLSIFVKWIAKNVPIEFHHGDCIGADDEAVSALKIVSNRRIVLRKCKVVCHPPTDDSKRAFNKYYHECLEPKPYIVRNHDIVDISNIMVACPSGPEQLRSGTWATIRYAKIQVKPIVIMWPNGDLTNV